MKSIAHPTTRFWRLCLAVVLSPLLALLLASLLNLAAPPQDADAKIIFLPLDYPCTSEGLHAAVDAASPGDTIRIDCDHILVTRTVVITKDLNLTSGEPFITPTRNFSPTVIDGGGNTRVFSVTKGTNVTMTLFIITNSISLGPGGAIYNEGDLTLFDVSLVNNSSDDKGGAIYNAGTLTAICTQQATTQVLAPAQPTEVFIDECMWISNNAPMGAALYNDTLGYSRIDGYRQWSNTAAGDGGGTNNAGWLAVINVNSQSNQAFDGAAFFNGSHGIMVAFNGVISDNIASNNGGGVNNMGSATVCAVAPPELELIRRAWLFQKIATLALKCSGNTLTQPFQPLEAQSPAFNANVVYTPTMFSDNHAGQGGAIYSLGALTVTNAAFISNSASMLGGGLAAQTAGGATLVGSSAFISNTANSSGGAISLFGSASLTLSNSLIYSNTAFAGAGIDDYASALTVVNSTVSGNTAQYGAGLNATSPVTITVINSTIVSNSNTLNINGGGLSGGSGSYSLTNTIVANNMPSNCSSVGVNSAGHNIDSGENCQLSAAGDMTDTNPLLGPLADNGGPTRTYFPLNGSPARNSGTNVGCPATDQRGVLRPQAVICDIGAVEVGALPSLTSLNPTSTPAQGPGFDLAVNGGNFIVGSVVLWNNAPRATSFVSGTQLSALISAGDIVATGTVTITVQTFAPDGGIAAGSLPFTISAALKKVFMPVVER